MAYDTYIYNHPNWLIFVGVETPNQLQFFGPPYGDEIAKLGATELQLQDLATSIRCFPDLGEIWCWSNTAISTTHILMVKKAPVNMAM